MSGDIEQQIDVMLGLKTVLSRIQNSVERRSKDLPQIYPTLVAVSKIKPISLIIQAYEAGQRHFGENYVNELSEKANDPQILEKCKDIKWHFIGHLQTNKINKLLRSPNLYMVETVDSIKLADNLDKQWAKLRPEPRPLPVLLQLNTSGEESKSGAAPAQAEEVARHVAERCPHLALRGLMAIGRYGGPAPRPDPDFVLLARLRDQLAAALARAPADLHLSMGMSADYEHAIELGATIVRVGSGIFGARPPKPL